MRFLRDSLLTFSTGVLGCFLLAGCGEKDDPKPEPTSNNLTLELEHRGADGQQLKVGRLYQNALGQPYIIDQMLYYVSNIKLTRADGTVWVEPASYHLISGIRSANPTITLTNVPNGNYTSLTMSFGVDRAANKSTDQVGDLNPGNGMAWDWRTGYRFMVLEGDFQPAGGAVEPLIYHPGTDTAYRVMTLPLPQTATVSGTVAPDVHLVVDVNSIFGGPNKMDFTQPSQRNVMQGSPELTPVANNVTTIFRVDHVHN